MIVEWEMKSSVSDDCYNAIYKCFRLVVLFLESESGEKKRRLCNKINAFVGNNDDGEKKNAKR